MVLVDSSWALALLLVRDTVSIGRLTGLIEVAATRGFPESELKAMERLVDADGYCLATEREAISTA